MTIDGIIKQPTPPAMTNVLWVDTSNGSETLKVYNGGWKELSPSDSEYEQLKQELLDQMEETATKVTNNIVAGAPETMDTLKEVSDTILSNKNKVDYELNDIKSSVKRKLDNSTTLNEIKIKSNKDGTIVPNELEPVETDVVYRQGGTTLAVTELNLSDNMKIYRTMPIKIVPHKYLLENNAGSDYVNIMTNNLTYNDVLIGYYCDDKGNYMHNDNEDKLLATNITKTSDPSIVINNTTDEYIYAVLYIVGNSAEALPYRVNIATNNAEKLKQASTDAAAALSGLDKKQDKAMLYSSYDEMDADTSQVVGTLGTVVSYDEEHGYEYYGTYVYTPSVNEPWKRINFPTNSDQNSPYNPAIVDGDELTYLRNFNGVYSTGDPLYLNPNKIRVKTGNSEYLAAVCGITALTEEEFEAMLTSKEGVESMASSLDKGIVLIRAFDNLPDTPKDIDLPENRYDGDAPEGHKLILGYSVKNYGDADNFNAGITNYVYAIYVYEFGKTVKYDVSINVLDSSKNKMAKTVVSVVPSGNANEVILGDGSTITFDELKTKLGIQS